MTNPLLEIEWEACPIEPARDPALEAYARQRMGTVPPTIGYLASRPWVAHAMVDLSFNLGLLTRLDMGTAEIVTMAVSQAASCRYCYSISRALLRIQGKSEAEVRQIEERMTGAAGDTRQVAALGLARRMAGANPLLTWQDLLALQPAGFDEDAIRELAFVVAYTVMANRVATLLALPPQEMERLPDRWFVRGFRPLLAWMLSRHDRMGKRVEPVPAGDIPFGYVVEAYAGLPIGPALARSLREIWMPSPLTRRCKALLFAVVARGVGCDLSERATQALLAEEGLSGNDSATILAHLRSDQLDPQESVLLPFARQTIWYQPAPVQRECRKLLEVLSREQFVEAVGILAMANALCRLSAAVIRHP
jgi:uncharacterized peroxidase-related enzyme